MRNGTHVRPPTQPATPVEPVPDRVRERRYSYAMMLAGKLGRTGQPLDGVAGPIMAAVLAAHKHSCDQPLDGVAGPIMAAVLAAHKHSCDLDHDHADVIRCRWYRKAGSGLVLLAGRWQRMIEDLGMVAGLEQFDLIADGLSPDWPHYLNGLASWFHQTLDELVKVVAFLRDLEAGHLLPEEIVEPGGSASEMREAAHRELETRQADVVRRLLARPTEERQ